MKTPVWFVMDENKIFVQTGADTGKVKRIRNNGKVNIAPCKMDGKITGSWLPAQARETSDQEICLQANCLLGKKYGLQKKLFDNQRTKKGVKDIILEIQVVEKEII